MNGEEKINTVFVVAASPIVRAGLESVLRTSGEIIAAGSAAEISAAPVHPSAGRYVDALLVHVERQKEFDRLLEFLSESGAAEDGDFPPVVALLPAELQTAEHIFGVLRGGASGILPSDAATEKILAAVKSAAVGLTALAPEMTEELLSSSGENDSFGLEIGRERQAPNDDAIENLTARESEILEMLAEGASNKSIARQLNISEHTVKFHVASVFGKLGVNTRTEAVTQALKRGLILL